MILVIEIPFKNNKEPGSKSRGTERGQHGLSYNAQQEQRCQLYYLLINTRPEINLKLHRFEFNKGIPRDLSLLQWLLFLLPASSACIFKDGETLFDRSTEIILTREIPRNHPSPLFSNRFVCKTQKKKNSCIQGP